MCKSSQGLSNCMYNVATSSPKKKRKLEKDKRRKGEKVTEKAIESFVKYQNEVEEKFKKWEEEHWIKLEQKRRREE